VCITVGVGVRRRAQESPAGDVFGTAALGHGRSSPERERPWPGVQAGASPGHGSDPSDATPRGFPYLYLNVMALSRGLPAQARAPVASDSGARSSGKIV